MGLKKPTKTLSGISESEVRAMRNLVYGHEISDNEWETCKRHWMEPSNIIWLRNWIRDNPQVLTDTIPQ